MKMFCELCKTEMNSSALGWICPKCKAFRDMKGVTHPHVEKPFMPPQTNGDYIRSMSDEKLCDFMREVYDRGYEDAAAAAYNNINHTAYDFEISLEWLRQIREDTP